MSDVRPDPDAATPARAPGPDGGRPDDGPRERRPIIERIGMAAIAAVLAVLFGGVGVASWIGGEPFLAIMGVIGCVMTAWVGGQTLFRG